jgi:CubicO group peptidase (beta-lactamase class C family)
LDNVETALSYGTQYLGKYMRNWLTLSLVFLSLTACKVPENSSLDTTYDYPWEYATPESQGFDSEILTNMLKRIQKDDLDVNSILLMKGDQVFLEFYRYPYDADSLFSIMSVTKSIVSAMTGIALDREVLVSTHDPLMTYLNEYDPLTFDTQKQNITVKHALTMTTGLACTDTNEQEMKRIFRSSDWTRAGLECPQAYSPGEGYGYSSIASHLLGVALAEATNTDLLALSKEWLFEPLGMDEVFWESTPGNYRLGGGWIWMKPRDMLRFGKLYIDEGQVGNNQLISQDWIESSISNQIGELNATTEEIRGEKYGYSWWVIQGSPVAVGQGGQTILLIPELDIVAVITQANEAVDLVGEYIVPALKSYLFSWPNESGNRELNQWVSKLAQAPASHAAKIIPPMAARNASRLHTLPDSVTNIYHNNFNNPRVTGLQFKFTGNESDAQLILKTEDDSIVLDIGLDGIARFSAAGFFGRRPDGKGQISASGQWISEQTFELTLFELGYPQVERWQVTFNDTELDVTVDSHGSSIDKYSFQAEAQIH